MRAVGRIVPRANGSFPSGEGRQASVSWAGSFVEGRRRPAELMGLTRYQQTVSADIGNLRGLHDIDGTGWWVLISLVPLIGWIVLLMFHVQDGTPGTNRNRFGPNPKSARVV